MHIPVNVADRPELSDFRFPALITRGPVSLGIATAGAAPVLASVLRRRIEAALPQELEDVLDAAAALTAELRRTVPDQEERTRILRRELEKMLE